MVLDGQNIFLSRHAIDEQTTVDFCAGAHAAILAWRRTHDRALAGLSWEVYGDRHADPALRRMSVYYLLQEAGAEGSS